MTRGRKPQSTETRRLTGNAGKRALNTKEPTPPPVADDTVPTELAGNAGATAEWQRLCPMLRERRQITEADRSSLIALCLEWSRYLHATRQVEAHGMVIRTTSGYPMISPYLSIATKALSNCARLWPELGLTPSSRSRVRTTGDEPHDPFAEFDAPPPPRTH